MSIIKNTPNFLKHAGLSFTTLINSTIDLIKDPGTLGVYVYLASKPNDWKISERNLQNRFERGRDYIRARMSELKLLGLLKSTAIRDDKGIIIRWETILYNEPQITENPYSGENPRNNAQITDHPDYWKSRHLDNPPTTNKRLKQIKENNNIALFDEWYSHYPRKKGKSAAVKWFNKNKPTKEFVAMLIEDVIKRKASDWNGKEETYIPYASTYLNQSIWEDAIDSKHSEKPKFPTPDERAANEQLIRQREVEAQKRKEEEIESSKGFNSLLNEAKKKISFKERLRIYQLSQEKIKNEST